MDQSEDTPAAAAGGRIVDSHHHLWDLGRHRYPWLESPGDPGTTSWIGDYAPIRRTFSIDEFLTHAVPCGIVKSVHVEAIWGGDPVEETRWVQSVADRHGFPQAIVAAVDLRAPDAATQLDRHLESRNMRGVRMSQLSGLISGRDFRRGFAALAERGLSYDLNIRFEVASEALRLAEAFPQTPILVDNMANPVTLEAGYLAKWSAAMKQLARAPNVVMKVSGLGMADHRWTEASIRPWIRAALEVFGPARCMFGSNWPVDSLYSGYRALVDATRSIVGDLSAAQQLDFFAATAERCYRI